MIRKRSILGLSPQPKKKPKKKRRKKSHENVSTVVNPNIHSQFHGKLV